APGALAAEDGGGAAALRLRDDGGREHRRRLGHDLDVELLDAHPRAHDRVAAARGDVDGLLEDLTLLEVAGEGAALGLRPRRLRGAERHEDGRRRDRRARRNRLRLPARSARSARSARARRLSGLTVARLAVAGLAVAGLTVPRLAVAGL